MARFKAIEVDAATRQRTGRTFELDAEGRQAAITALLGHLGLAIDQARVDPSRTLVEVGGAFWTMVAAADSSPRVSSGLRRGGAKHKSVR